MDPATAAAPSRTTALTRRLEVIPARALDFLALARPDDPAYAWSAPDGDVLLVAFGRTLEIQGGGGDLAALGQRCGEATADLRWTGDRDSAARPRWLGGFAFAAATTDPAWSAFPPAQFTLPAATLIVAPDAAWLTVAASDAQAEGLARRLGDLAAGLAGLQGPAPELPPLVASTPGPDPGRRAAAALDAIRAGRADKVVVATHRRLTLAAEVDLGRLLEAMAAREPACFHFLVSPSAGTGLVGASPEALAAVADNRLRTAALAGSAALTGDATADRQLAKDLMASAKNRAEHAFVVAAIRRALAPLETDIPRAPRIRRLARLLHLETPIVVALPDEADVLALAQRLHPTPALAGSPRSQALDVIAEIEPEGRGWYGGAVGWIDGRGEGDLAVAIRCLLVRGAEVLVHAGAGIVADSEPEAEAQEIEAKLAATLAVLFQTSPGEGA